MILKLMRHAIARLLSIIINTGERPNDKLLFVKRAFLRAKREMQAAIAFPVLILIDCRDVKQLRLANENLRIPEDTISMPKLARI